MTFPSFRLECARPRRGSSSKRLPVPFGVRFRARHGTKPRKSSLSSEMVTKKHRVPFWSHSKDFVLLPKRAHTIFFCPRGCTGLSHFLSSWTSYFSGRPFLWHTESLGFSSAIHSGSELSSVCQELLVVASVDMALSMARWQVQLVIRPEALIAHGSLMEFPTFAARMCLSFAKTLPHAIPGKLPLLEDLVPSESSWGSFWLLV